MEHSTIVWFQKDLRTHHHQALLDASLRGHIIPIFIWSSEAEGEVRLGSASRVMLYQVLRKLASDFQSLSIPFFIFEGNPLDVLINVLRKTNAKAVYWTKRYEPSIRKRNHKILITLREYGVDVKEFEDYLLFPIQSILNKKGNPYQVYTHFYNECIASHSIPSCVDAPTFQETTIRIPSKKLDELRLLESRRWEVKIQNCWGSEYTTKLWEQFLSTKIENYHTNRDVPSIDSTSRLSPYLHFGTISVRKLADDLSKLEEREFTTGKTVFFKELIWRDFAYYILYHFPFTINEPLHTEYKSFPWENNSSLFEVWKRGETGFPIIDAGMRQLWNTGWMHNRVRMIVASFLVKNLLIDWRMGAEWFWDTLVDADLANNTFNWQWAAGCGADAAPFFRIFNPVLQSKKFDPNGDYIRKWVPELAHLNKKQIHEPWKFYTTRSNQVDVGMGKKYPVPIVNLSYTRDRALAIWMGLEKIEN